MALPTNLKKVNCESKVRLCLIPGGPGLGSASLESLRILSRSFDVMAFDPPGTGSSSSKPDQTFESNLELLEDRLIGEDDVLLVGHSFGGLYAAAIAQRDRVPVSGIVLLGTPLTVEAMAYAGAQYEKHASAESKSLGQSFQNSPSDAGLRRWLASYGSLYFAPENVESGRSMLLAVGVSHAAFLNIRVSKLLQENDFPAVLRTWIGPKLMLAGEHDRLLPPSVLQKDAERADAGFSLVKGAGHFMGFDQPEAVAQLIETNFG